MAAAPAPPRPPLLLPLLVLLLLADTASSAGGPKPERNPRYVLCPSARPPSVQLPGGRRVLRVFAASVAGNDGPARHRFGRPPAALALRAALLVDDPDVWVAETPKHENHRTDDGHARGISYAKCLGAGFPEETEVGCRLGPLGGRQRAAPERNETDWSQFGHGRLVRFRNVELIHDFAHCVLGAEALRWRLPPGPPARLHVRLGIRAPTEAQATVLPLELCRVERPLLNAAFCSQPLYGLVPLQREVPWAVDDWLEYHLGHLGFEHGEVYDIDGSLAEALGPERLARFLRRGRLSYRPRFPANLSSSLAELSQQHPYCAETWAYSHCLTTHRALSRFVLLLHAPDEYLLSQRRPEERGLLKVLLEYERGMPIDEPVSLMRVRASSFARGGPGDPTAAAAALPPREAPLVPSAAPRGAVLAASRLRGELRYMHSPLLDPALCICAGPHTCYSEAESEFPGLVQEIEPEDLVVHHYVEMLDRNVGRCSQHHTSCNIEDFSASRLLPLLRGP